jgi:hypothetical protein
MAATEVTKPLDNLTYDIVSILHEKSQALVAYESYLEDARSEPDVLKVLEEVRKHDEEDIHKLRFELGRLLARLTAPAVAEPSAEVGRSA